MNDRDLPILKYIITYTLSHGYPPCVREIAQALDQSFGTISNKLRRLRREGLITYNPTQARTYHVLCLPYNLPPTPHS